MKKPSYTRQTQAAPDLFQVRDLSEETVLEEIAALVPQLKSLQATIPGPKPGQSISNADFAVKYLGMDGATWGRIMSDKYVVKDWRPILLKLRGGVSMLKRASADLEQLTPGASSRPNGLLEFAEHQIIFNGVDSALNADRNRILPVIGKTGAGKSKLRALLEHRHPTKVLSLQASKPWKGRYTAIWKELAKALQMSKPPRGAWDLQEAVVQQLSRAQKIIVIDECQYVAEDAADGIKFINDKTSCVTVMLTTPEQWKHVKDNDANWDNIDQLLNRVYGQFELCVSETGAASLDAGDVALFVQSHLKQFADLEKPEQAKIITLLKNAGEHFGLWNKVGSLVEEVQDMAGDGNPISEGSFKAAAEILRKMRRA